MTVQPRPGLLRTQSWGGVSVSPVTIIGETARKYRITAEQPTQLAGRNRWLMPGNNALVPKAAVLEQTEGK